MADLKTYSVALAEAKINILKEGAGWTFADMQAEEAQDFIWGYLYDENLEYLQPIPYGDKGSVILVHKEK